MSILMDYELAQKVEKMKGEKSRNAFLVEVVKEYVERKGKGNEKKQ